MNECFDESRCVYKGAYNERHGGRERGDRRWVDVNVTVYWSVTDSFCLLLLTHCARYDLDCILVMCDSLKINYFLLAIDMLKVTTGWYTEWWCLSRTETHSPVS